MEPKRGDIALCSRGAKGLITSEEPELKRFQNGVEQLVWMGIYIEDFEEKRIGDPWYSQNPLVIDEQFIEGLRVLYFLLTEYETFSWNFEINSYNTTKTYLNEENIEYMLIDLTRINSTELNYYTNDNHFENLYENDINIFFIYNN